MRLIPDKNLLKIAIKDNGEGLINLKDFSSRIVVELEEISRKEQDISRCDCFVRETVAVKLKEAASLLPMGFKFKIIDGYRPIMAQKIIYSQVFNNIQNKHSKWSLKKVESETDKWVANPKLASFHMTGGAIDLTIINKNNKELDMGNPINSISNKSKTNYLKISQTAKLNRGLLIKAMTKAGFVNLPSEWWHWSYGDRYWAAVNNTYALYGAI